MLRPIDLRAMCDDAPDRAVDQMKAKLEGSLRVLQGFYQDFCVKVVLRFGLWVLLRVSASGHKL